MIAGPQIALGGAAVGLAVGLTGMGGGALMAPLLVLVFGVDPLTAVSSDLLSSLAMKPVGAWVHVKRGTVQRGVAAALCAGSVPAAFAGACAVECFGQSEALHRGLRVAIGAALLLACAGILLRRALERRGQVAPPPFSTALPLRVLPTVLVGALGGLVVGATSVGAGSLMMVMLLALYPALDGGSLVGTDLVQAIPLVGSAALGHALFGQVELGLTGWLVLGALPAVYLGARLSARAPARLICWALFAVLLASGLKMVGVSGGWLVLASGGAVLVALGVAAVRRWRGGAPAAADVKAHLG
jgi:uncharacterized membrane protein YfcA